MFYSQFILAKKGPLGTIWIAAHLERKLRKNQVAETDIGVTVDNILFPEVPIALRLSGHLLLGVVRIYSRQVNYLFNDCSETLGKIKQAFHSAAVDLPPEATTAPFHSITLPETFDFDELELGPDSDSAFLHLNGKYVDHHVTTREQITLQDCIDNNPYLGSSQFGLDERFGDGSYSSLGLDFDEEFWASKAGSSSIASTSTPLPKEDFVVPPARGENEVTHMDVDDPYAQLLQSDVQKGKSIEEAVNAEAGQIEKDSQPNMSISAIPLSPFNEPAGSEMALRKDSETAALKQDTPTFHVYTPRVLEACTPDLNQEYCPPDEPSTPALVDETSLPVHNERNTESAGRFSPVTSGNIERSSFSELVPVSLSPQQVSCVNTGASVQATRSPSPVPFQGFSLQQAIPADTNREALLTQKEEDQGFSVKESTVSASMPFHSFPQLNLIQQTRTPLSHEGAVFPKGTSNSFSTSTEASLSSLHQRDGNLPMTVSQQLAATVNQEAHPRLQQQGLAAGLENPVSSSAPTPGTGNQEVYTHFRQQGLSVGSQNLGSSYGATGGLAGTVNSGVYSSYQQQGPANGSQNPESAFGAMVGSAGNANDGIHPSFQQQAAVGSQKPVSSFAATAGSAGTASHIIHPNSQQQGLSVGSQNPVSSSGMVGSTGTASYGIHPSSQQQGLVVSSANPVSSFGAIVGSAGTASHGIHPSSQQQALNPASSFGATVGSGTTTHGIHPNFQQQGPVGGSQNPASAIGATVGSAGTTSHGIHPNFQQQGPVGGSQNPASAIGAMVGSAGTTSHGIHPSFQQQGTVGGSQNPASAIGAMVGSAGTTSHGIHPSSQQQGPAGGSNNAVSSFGATIGSAAAAGHGFHQSPQQQGLAAGSQNPVSSFGAMAGSAGTASLGIHSSSQQQALAVDSQNLMPSSGSMAGLAGDASHGIYPSSQQQGLTGGSQNAASSFGAMVGSSGTMSRVIHPSSQQQGFAVGSQNPVSSFGAMAGLIGTASLGIHPSSQQQDLAVGSQNPVSSFGSMAAVAGSLGIHPSSQQQGLAVGSQNSVSSSGAMAGLAGNASHGIYPSSQHQGLAVGSHNSVSSCGAMAGLAGNASHGIYPSSQQQGLAVGSQNLVSSSGVMAGLAGNASHGIYPSSQQQGLAVGSQNATSSFGAMAGLAGTGNHNIRPSSQQQGLGSPSLVSSFGAMVGSTGAVGQAVYPTFQQRGLAIGSQNPVSSFGAMVESTASQSPSTTWNVGISQRVLASPHVSEASVTPAFSAVSGSFLPALSTVHMENMNSNKEALHKTLDSAAAKGPLGRPAGQQLSISSPAAKPGQFSSLRMGECETLRSAYDLQTGNSGFLMLQKDMSVGRIPGLESERNKFLSAATDGFSKEGTLPAMDKTPILRDETPYSFTRAPFSSTHSINSLPADDDVLASILGRRSKAFKVVTTPKVPKEPKINVAKRPKRAPRMTPKKRKIELDTVAVLHGDVIRQQLANAEDIRRERRKAPCTRREVWGFLRESEGQENFDEPTLPELSPDLHDLYHDVLHGRESRPLSSPLNGAVKANQPVESQLIRSGEIECLVNGGVNNDANRLGPRVDSVPLVDSSNNNPSRDVCINEFVGTAGEKNLTGNLAEQLNEGVKLELAQTKPFGGTMGAEDAEKLNVEEVLKPEAGTEGLVGKEMDVITLPESQVPEDHNPSRIISMETEANGQLEQIIGLHREFEGLGLTKKDFLVSSLPGNLVGVIGADESIAMAVQSDTLGVVGADVGTQERAMALQKDVLGLVCADVGTQKIAMAVQNDVLCAVGAEAGTQKSAMAMQNDVLGAVGAETGTQKSAMAVQNDVLGAVGAEAGTLKSAMAVQTDVLGAVGAEAGTLKSAMAVQNDVLGAMSAEVGTQDSTMPIQHVAEQFEEKQQVSVGVHQHDVHEGEHTLLGKGVEFKALNILSDGKDVTQVPIADGKDASEVPVSDGKDASEMPVSLGKDTSEVPLLNVVDIDKEKMEGSDKLLDKDQGNMEGTDKLPTFNVTEEETNLCKADEEMAAMDCERDTDFLDEDNDVAYAEIDYSSDEQDNSIQDGNGWSARSRNVGRFLKTVFEEMEGNSKRLEQGPTLGLERLLARKTKREAARMFFETLVLKTKDYIHVEQNVAYQDIHLYPRSKLMKTEF